jgi:MoaA/NifB/PqqE/SkfB family radical SAM enzyme
VRRDGLITVSNQRREEELWVDPGTVVAYEKTGLWPAMTEAEMSAAKNDGRFLVYGQELVPNGGFMSAPRSIQWTSTSGCNLRCKHCYASSAERSEDELTTDEVLHIVDQACAMGVDSLHVLGGEPFFREDMARILRYASEHGLRCHVSSNGTLVDDAVAKELSGLPGLTVDISLDSASAELHDWLRGSGAFLAAHRGIEHLQHHGVRFSTTCTINPRTLPRMEDVVQQAVRLGAYRVQFLIVSPVGRASKHESELLLSGEQRQLFAKKLGELYEQYGQQLVIDSPAASPVLKRTAEPAYPRDALVFSGCMAGIDKMAICADGSATACPHLQEVFGDVRKQKLARVWTNMHRQRLERLGWGCEATGLQGICGGGCPAPERHTDEVAPCSGRGAPAKADKAAVEVKTAWCPGDCLFPCSCPRDCFAPCSCPGDCPFPCLCPRDCLVPCSCPTDCRFPCLCPSDCRCPLPCSCPSHCALPCLCPTDCRCPLPCSCPSHCALPCLCPTDCRCPIPCCPSDYLRPYCPCPAPTCVFPR